MTTTCYLVLSPKMWAKKISGLKVIRVTQGKPALEAGQVAVRLIVEADESVFDPAAVAVLVSPRAATLALTPEDAGEAEEAK